MPTLDRIVLPGARFWWVLAVATVAGIWAPAPATAQNPSWEKELAANLPQALARLKQFYSQVRCRAVVRTKPGGDKERIGDTEFAIDGERIRVVQHCRVDPSNPRRVGMRVVSVVNPSLSFSLNKPPGHEDYAVSWVGRRDSMQDARSQREDLSAILQDLKAPFSVWGEQFSNSLALPTYRVRRIEEVVQDGIAALRVHYEIHLSPSAKDDTSAGWPDTVEGWIVVSPKLGWAIQAYKQYNYDSHHPNGKWPKLQSVYGRAWYEGEQDGVPLLRRTESRILADGMPLDFDYCRKTEYIDLRHGPTPESDFTPESFGVRLSIPGGSGHVRRYVWIGLAALLALVGAVFLKGLARRKRDRSPEIGNP